MKYKFIRKHLEILVVCLLGLTPLLWFRGQEVILGHDSGLPIDPVNHFLDRLSMWTYRFGVGNDQSYATPGFFFHGFEALVQFFTNNLQLTQKITFVFWFIIPGLMMFYLGRKVEDKFELKFIALPAAAFYMFNHFLLQAWFVAERTKISLYAALPLLIVLFFDWMEEKRSTMLTAIYISLLFFFLNGLASLPLFGSVIVAFLVFTSFYLVLHHSKKDVLRISILYIETFCISFFLQLYWLLPYSTYLRSSYQKSVEFFGGESGILGWVKYISENSSISNILRLQGVPEWYQNPLHPYASIFLNNPILIFVSIMIPILCFAPFVFIRGKEKRIYLMFFGFLALVSIVFVSGAHPPFGFFYLLLVEYIPGFIAFRTPFYKFGSGLWFSYAILIGVSMGFILHKVGVKKRSEIVFKVIIIVGIVMYSFPFLNGSFFDYIKGQRTNRIQVPSYIYQFEEWSKNEGKNHRVLVLPEPNRDLPIDAYTWGYWSLAPITTLLTNNSVLNLNSYLTDTEKVLIDQMYKKMGAHDDTWYRTAQLLDIDTLLLRHDFDWSLKDTPTTSPEKYSYLINDNHVSNVQKFGKWDLLSIKKANHSNVKSFGGLTAIYGDQKTIPDIVSLPTYNSKRAIFSVMQNQQVPEQSYAYLIKDSYTVATCVMCNLEYKFINQDLFTPLILRGSRFYPITKYFVANNYTRNKTAISLSYQSLENLLETQKAIDLGTKTSSLKLYTDYYQNSLTQLIYAVKNEYRKSNNYDIDITLELLSNWHLQTLILKQIEDRIMTSAGRYNDLYLNSFLSYSQKISKLSSDMDNLIWRTKSVDEKKLIIRTKLDGIYTLFVKSNNRVSNDKHAFKLSINGQEIPGPSSEFADFNEYHYINLKKGENRISLNQESPNLFSGATSIEFSKENAQCIKSNLVKTERNEIFKISFKHSTFDNGKFFIRPFSEGTALKATDDVETIISNSHEQYYETDYAGAGNSFYILICNRENPKSRTNTNLSIKDFRINLVNIPEIIAYNNLSTRDDITSTPRTRKIKQTEYDIDKIDTRTRIIGFTQSYDSNWVGSGQHILLNGYANGWILDKGTNAFTINYSLQNLFIIGAIISFISFCVCISFIILRRLR